VCASLGPHGSRYPKAYTRPADVIFVVTDASVLQVDIATRSAGYVFWCKAGIDHVCCLALQSPHLNVRAAWSSQAATNRQLR
jgi:hypothetical protein